MRIVALEGRRVLVVEDDYFIADEVASNLERRGAEVVGPVGTVSGALELLDGSSPDAAVLDINLRGEMAYVIADALIKRDIPFVFATGYDANVIPERFAGVPRCRKPVSYAELARALA